MTFLDGGKHEGAFDKDCMAGEESSTTLRATCTAAPSPGTRRAAWAATCSRRRSRSSSASGRTASLSAASGSRATAPAEARFEGASPSARASRLSAGRGQQPATYEYADDGTMTALKFSGTTGRRVTSLAN